MVADGQRLTRVRARIVKLLAMAADPRLPAAARSAYQAKADQLAEHSVADAFGMVGEAARGAADSITNLTSALDDVDELYGYDALVAAMGYDVLVQVDSAGYQGDSMLVLRDGPRHGYLTFGWGSCSGCDALEACDGADDVAALREELRGQAVWHDSLIGLKQYVREKDWSLEWMDSADCSQFVFEVLALEHVAIPGQPIALGSGAVR